MKHLFVIQILGIVLSTSLGFAQNTLHYLQKNGIELMVALSSTNAKTVPQKLRGLLTHTYVLLLVWGFMISTLQSLEIFDHCVFTYIS